MSVIACGFNGIRKKQQLATVAIESYLIEQWPGRKRFSSSSEIMPTWYVKRISFQRRIEATFRISTENKRLLESKSTNWAVYLVANTLNGYPLFNNDRERDLLFQSVSNIATKTANESFVTYSSL